ncbi:MAG TPA: aminotransferase class I/II-fold pyridoxal phosphate-dependent enzyme, partial [Acetobacteraceae bacterium]|nr:aminotransferase class I/II-fold pyridoxal phosphate-dependent enzyme [Acetobacteraceae bacterium]
MARRRFAGAPEPFIDLSTGINPYPYPLPVLPGLAFTRLPEPEAAARLEAAAAEAYGAAGPALVAAAPGTQILIELLPLLWPVETLAVLTPTYGEYAVAWRRTNCVVSPVEALDEIGNEKAVVVCNPNNPDGRIIPPPVLLQLADRLERRGGLLVVDEAFADLAPDGTSLAPALPHPALIVLRSFGKTYGMAGLRLGFALASRERISVIRAALGPWAVSGPAIAIGSRALADKVWRATMKEQLAAEASRLDSCLTEAGLRVTGGT